MWPHQVEQAARYRMAHKSRVDALEEALLATIENYVATVASKVMKPEIVGLIREDLASGDPSRYPRTLRFEAVSITTTCFSRPYWMAIDALNFFADAVGANWPYMDDAKRGWNIESARDEMQQLQRWLQDNRSSGLSSADTVIIH